jgi:uncharacterized membrane protein
MYVDSQNLNGSTHRFSHFFHDHSFPTKVKLSFIIFFTYDNIRKDTKWLEVNIVRYFWAFFWAFLLVQMLTYVVSSMVGTTYNVQTGSILAIIVTVMIFVISAIIPNEPVEKH